MTSYSRIPVADNQNVVTAGERGPVLMQDFQLWAVTAEETLMNRLTIRHWLAAAVQALAAIGLGLEGAAVDIDTG